MLGITLVLLLAPGEAILIAKIWVASWLPYAYAIDQSEVTRYGDKVVHFGLFLALAVLAALSWRGTTRLAQVLVALVLLAVVTEILQNFIPGRGAEIIDLVVDLLGLGFGVFLLRRLIQSRSR